MKKSPGGRRDPALAVDAEVSGVDLSMVGLIRMAAGGIGPLLNLLVSGPGDRATHEGVIETAAR